jgi:hypothetical protein
LTQSLISDEMMTEKLISMQSMGNNKYSILYVMIVCLWLGNRNVRIGHMTTVHMTIDLILRNLLRDYSVTVHRF